MIKTEVGEVYRYRGSQHTSNNYWTIYEQRLTSMFFSGSSNRDHLGSVGTEYTRGSGAGRIRGSRWELLV